MRLLKTLGILVLWSVTWTIAKAFLRPAVESSGLQPRTAATLFGVLAVAILLPFLFWASRIWRKAAPSQTDAKQRREGEIEQRLRRVAADDKRSDEVRREARRRLDELERSRSG